MFHSFLYALMSISLGPYTTLVGIVLLGRWGNWCLNVRFPDFSSHVYSIALSHIWHSVFITPTWKRLFMTSYSFYYYSVLVEILGCRQPFQNVQRPWEDYPSSPLPSPHSPLPLASAPIQCLYDTNTSASFLCIFSEPLGSKKLIGQSAAVSEDILCPTHCWAVKMM